MAARIIGRVGLPLTPFTPITKTLRPKLEFKFGTETIKKGTHLFHAPGTGTPGPIMFTPMALTSPFFYKDDEKSRWKYELQRDVNLLKLYNDNPPLELSDLSRTCLKHEAYTSIFRVLPELELHEWSVITDERDKLMDAIFGLGFDGWISTGDLFLDDRVEVCINDTNCLSYEPRVDDAIQGGEAVPYVKKVDMKTKTEDLMKDKIIKQYSEMYVFHATCIQEEVTTIMEDTIDGVVMANYHETTQSEALKDVAFPPEEDILRASRKLLAELKADPIAEAEFRERMTKFVNE